MFVIEDERHAELQDGEFASLAEAVEELKRRATIPWNEAPNVAPCTSWRTCGRTYEVVEYDMTEALWKQLQRHAMLEVTAEGAKWLSPHIIALSKDDGA
jgi:hypothetical protein